MTRLLHKEIGQETETLGTLQKMSGCAAAQKGRTKEVTVQKYKYSAAIPGSLIPLSCAPKGGKQLTGDWTMYKKKQKSNT